MAKFQSTEARVYPTLGLTLEAGEVVDLPEETNVAGLIQVVEVESKPAKAAPVKEVGE